MYHRVRIKKLPEQQMGGTKTGQQTADGALAIQPTAMGGADIDQYIGKKPLTVKKTMEPIDRDKANVEVEKGEIIAGDINGSGILQTFVAGGKRHSEGGTPLNLPDDTFIFSDTKSMKIKDPEILKKYGKTSGSHTPAALAKQYDVNKYLKILQDPDSDSLDKKTAELMVRNYTMKLGSLALAQESKKAFPQGIPKVSEPYLQSNNIAPENVLPTYKRKFPRPQDESEPVEEEVSYDESMPTEMPSGEEIALSPEMMEGSPMAAYGMNMGGFGFPYTPEYADGGLIKAQNGLTKEPYSAEEAYTPKGVVELNKYRKMYGLPQIKGRLTKQDIQVAAGELQAKIIATNPDLVVDYMSTKAKPNKKLLNMLPAGYAKTTAGVKQALNDGKLTPDQIKSAYKDDKWWYRALQTNTKELSKAEYEKKMKDPNAIKQGDALFFQDDPNDPQSYTQYVIKEDPAKENDEEFVDTEDADDSTIENQDYMDYATPPSQTRSRWMTPDVLNYAGTLGDRFRLKRYYPWAPRVDLEEQQGRYLDVARPAAAIAEQANIAQQNLAQFVGSPQIASARALAIQGQASKNVADLISTYNNQNVGIANQLAQTNTNIRNQERLQNQQIDKQLYDQTVLMNQQYDNAKAAARQNIRTAFNTGWKNASDLAMVNAMSEQYDIDPVTGNVIFQGGKPNTPQQAQTFDALLDHYENERGYAPELAFKAAKEAMKYGYGSSGTGIDLDAILQNAKEGGIYVMGDTIFPFMFY